jgi:hypothetical protein
MTTYRTMTVDGGYGSSFEADSWDEADKKATDAGYKVLDYTTGLGDDSSEENILVIAD